MQIITAIDIFLFANKKMFPKLATLFL